MVKGKDTMMLWLSHIVAPFSRQIMWAQISSETFVITAQ